MIVVAHERFIAGKPGGKRAALRFVDLSRADLSGRDLSDADLSASILDGAKLAGANLSRANLFGCDLRKADLRMANLTRADLRGACLRGADLSRADLSQADFRIGQIAIPHPSKGLASLSHERRHGQLDNAVLAGATLHGSQMDEASAYAADFTDCSLKGAKLARANCKDANFAGAIFDGVDLAGANLEGANLSNTVLCDVDVRAARLSDATNMLGAIGATSSEAMAKAPSLLDQALANHLWCKTGGREGRPAILDGEDLRPLGDKLRGLRLSADRKSTRLNSSH